MHTNVTACPLHATEDWAWSFEYQYSDIMIKQKLECAPMPNVMVALPNIGGALCSTPQSLVRAHCSTAVQ